MRLPPAIQRLFHRHRSDQLDTERHAALIIPTVLEDGDVDDWAWLFAAYGWDRLRNWIADPRRSAQLSPRVEWFWTVVLLGHGRETPRWQGGNGLRTVPPDALPDWFPEDWR